MNKRVHISVDDVVATLQRLTESEYKSIYEESFFWYMRLLHRLFGTKVTCYVFAHQAGWSISDMPDRYRREFESASDWLKFGFHAVSKEQKPDELMLDFAEQYQQVQDQLRRFAGEQSLAHVIRLHYWYYPKEYTMALKQNGVQAVLVRYDDSVEEIDGISAWRSQICIEQDKHIMRQIWNYHSDEPLVIFAHEWALTWKKKIKICFSNFLIRLRGYKFICE